MPLRILPDRNPRLDPARIDEVVLDRANQAGEDNRKVAHRVTRSAFNGVRGS